MKLKILIISKPYVAESYRDKLDELAKDERFEIGLITPPSWGSQKFEGNPTPSNYWLKIVPIRFNGKNHFHYYKSLSESILEFNPDIINVEEEHYSVVTWQVYRIAKKIGAKTVFYTWQNIYKDYPFPFSMIERYIFKHSNAAITGNNEATQVLKDKGYNGIVRRIPQMGVNLEKFQPDNSSLEKREERKEKLGLSKDSFWVIFAGRVVEEKGVQDLVKATITLNDPKIKLLILGSGPYLPTLKELASPLEEKGSIKYLDSIPSAKVAEYLKAIDVMCLPSLTKSNWKEQFGRIIIESMASEAVVLGSSSGEIPNVISDAGLTFQEGDAKELAQALKKLAHDKDLMQDLRQKGSKRVKDNYTNKIVAKSFGDLFLEIAK